MFKTISLFINPDLCRSCRNCTATKACRTKAIVQIDPGEMPYMEADRCRDCWACVLACPNGAIQKLNKEV